jgi:Domain of unknown function (DUF4912)
MAKREGGSGRAGTRKAGKPSSRAKLKATAKRTTTKAAAAGRSVSKAKKAAPPKAERPARKAASKARRGEGPKKNADLKKKEPRGPAARAATPRARGGAGPTARARSGRPRAAARGPATRPPVAATGLSDEEQILAAKYLPRDLPSRLFEEERFLFPETYHVNRVRLLVKDPDWIFAYWDVAPKALEEIGKSMGERALALARLSLRVSDPDHGGSTDILLPAGARWWYVRTDSSVRSYRAELGVILPSGEFRRLAESNRVTTPRVGPSTSSARRRAPYRKGVVPGTGGGEGATADEAPSADQGALGPWSAPSVEGVAGTAGLEPEKPPAGGASDAFRPGGASDAFRPGGASDIYRR